MIGTKSILLVEPDQEISVALRKTLERAGYVVVVAKDGREALNILSNNTIDLIISALRMPTLDGIELMEEINRTRMSVPVIFITARGDVESYMDVMNLGAFDYLNKPIEEQEIHRVAMSALTGIHTEIEALQGRLTHPS